MTDFITTFMFCPPSCLYVPADRTIFIGICNVRTVMRNWAKVLYRESDFENSNAGVAFRCGVEVSFDANSKIWREIEKNFGHKRNRLGAKAAREFEVYLNVNFIHLCEIPSRLSFHE